MKDVKEKGIFVNQDGVGKVLAPKPKKQITNDDIKKAIKKAQKQVQRSPQAGEDIK